MRLPNRWKWDSMNRSSYLGAATGLLLLALNQAAQADEPFLSPRAKDAQIRVVPRPSTKDPNLLLDRPVGNAHAWALAQSLRTVPGTGRDVDLVHGPRPSLSPKDPNYEVVLRALATQKFLVAPVGK
jgi:hypothetical protein